MVAFARPLRVARTTFWTQVTLHIWSRYYLQNTKNELEKAEQHYKRSLDVDGSRVATLCNYAALMKVIAWVGGVTLAHLPLQR